MKFIGVYSGQTKGKTGSLARRLRPHFAAVVDHSLSGTGQSQSYTVWLACGREWLEQPVPDFGSDSRPGVLNPDHYRAAVCDRRYVNAPPVGHGLQRIHEQIDDYLLDTAPIQNQRQPGLHRLHDLYRLKLGTDCYLVNGAGD